MFLYDKNILYKNVIDKLIEQKVENMPSSIFKEKALEMGNFFLYYLGTFLFSVIVSIHRNDLFPVIFSPFIPLPGKTKFDMMLKNCV